MNEPFPGSTWLSSVLGNTFYDLQQLTPMYNQVDAAIRAVDSTTKVFFEPSGPAAPELFSLLAGNINLGTVDDPNSVLAWHNYCGITAVCSMLADVLATAAQNYSTAHQIPAFMDEFGATSAQDELAAETTSANKKNMSWTVWAYTGKGDITTQASPNTLEALVYDPALPPTGSNVNVANLATLSTPYPQRISGTPESWSFGDGSFQFSYSTARADGAGSFDAGSQTVIWLPASAFPNGYQVNVTGGHVVPTADVNQLVIASNSGASAVEVVVTGNATTPVNA